MTKSRNKKMNQKETMSLNSNRTVLGRFDIRAEADLHIAVLHVQRNKRLAESFGTTEIAMLATVASELGRNILKYGHANGHLIVTWIDNMPNHGDGVEIKAIDRGPGFIDKQRAMSDHYSTSGTLGLGLPGVARIMNALEIESELGEGAVVTATMWVHRHDRKR
ncbi:MAG TPA: ATP-binding protein [Methyloceanibacter sp.]|nr:ATP-binding protein [Methyloceanibacter sp.]